MAGEGKVLIIYTGGTIGMVPSIEGNPLSPLKPAKWAEMKKFIPILNELKIDVTIQEMKLIDSSDMSPDYWVDIARVIGKHYTDYEGFVILHGTDTMTYTASALSFLLENLDKPVIVTGSQLSLSLPRSDAVQNLVTSLMIASPKKFNLPLVPEVCIYFNNILLRGNRTRKISSMDYTGFDSPNFDVIGRVGEHIRINEKVIRKPSNKFFFINENLEKNVLMFDIFPGLEIKILRALFDIPELKGVVLKTYGSGNAPTNEEFLKEIEYGISRKHLAIVSVSQCIKGMVEMGLYDASAKLQRLGVISGVDMTPEAALVKMQFLLGLGYDIETVKNQMQRDLRGEQRVNVFNFFFHNAQANPIYKAAPKQLPADFDRDKIVAANIRIDSAALLQKKILSEIKLAFFINYPNLQSTLDKTDEECAAMPQCLGILRRTFADEPLNIILDCKEQLRRVIITNYPVQLSIVSRTGETILWESASMSVYTSVE